MHLASNSAKEGQHLAQLLVLLLTLIVVGPLLLLLVVVVLLVLTMLLSRQGVGEPGVAMYRLLDRGARGSRSRSSSRSSPGTITTSRSGCGILLQACLLDPFVLLLLMYPAAFAGAACTCPKHCCVPLVSLVTSPPVALQLRVRHPRRAEGLCLLCMVMQRLLRPWHVCLQT